MKPDELEELLSDCPKLYHMAAVGSWPSIKKRGLLSTSALLDMYEVQGANRVEIETQRRPESVRLQHSSLSDAIIRDQIPMDDNGLSRCLPANMTPSDWYRLLNEKVFFWLTRDRLLRMLNAGAYRDSDHDVIEIRSADLFNDYKEKIWLCPINSGCTKPMPRKRDDTTFRRVGDYPYAEWRTKRRKGERVVEVAVDYAVSNLEDYVIRVVRMRRAEEVEVIFE